MLLSGELPQCLKYSREGRILGVTEEFVLCSSAPGINGPDPYFAG